MDDLIGPQGPHPYNNNSEVTPAGPKEKVNGNFIQQRPGKNHIPPKKQKIREKRLQERNFHKHAPFKKEDFGELEQAIATLDIDINALISRQESLKQSFSSVNQNLQQTQQAIAYAEEEVSPQLMTPPPLHDEESQRLKNKVTQLEQRLNETEQVLKDTRGAHQKAWEELETYSQRNKASGSTIALLQARVKKLSRVTDKQQAKLQAKNKQLVNLAAKLKEAKNQQKKLEDENQVMQEDYQRQVKLIEEQTEKIFSLREVVAQTTQSSQDADSELLTANEHLKTQNATLNKEIEEINRQVSHLQNKLLEQDTLVSELQGKKVESLPENVQAKAQAELQEKQKEIDALQQDLNALRQMQAKKPGEKQQENQLKQQLAVLTKRYEQMALLNKRLADQLNAVNKKPS